MTVKGNNFLTDCKITRTKNRRGMSVEDRPQPISRRWKAVGGVHLTWRSRSSTCEVLAEGDLHQEWQLTLRNPWETEGWHQVSQIESWAWGRQSGYEVVGSHISSIPACSQVSCKAAFPILQGRLEAGNLRASLQAEASDWFTNPEERKERKGWIKNN